MIFQYAQLGTDTIRLIRFHPRSTTSDLHVTLAHQAGYSAQDVHYSILSHEPISGPSEEQQRAITLNGRTRMLDANAWCALHAVWKDHQDHRQQEDQQFWLEALCVNHNDVFEVEAQRRQLSSIYASADQVLLWMKFDDESMNVEGDLLKRAGIYILQAKDREALRGAKTVLLLTFEGRRVVEIPNNRLEGPDGPRGSL